MVEPAGIPTISTTDATITGNASHPASLAPHAHGPNGSPRGSRLANFQVLVCHDRLVIECRSVFCARLVLRTWILQEAGLGSRDLVEITMFNRDELIELNRAAKANLLEKRKLPNKVLLCLIAVRVQLLMDLSVESHRAYSRGAKQG